MKILAVIVLVALAGCQAGSCIKVGGSYSEGEKTVAGNIEYCLDKPASEKAGEPVLSDKAGIKYVFLSETDAQRLVGADVAIKSSDPIFAQLRKKISGGK